MTLVFEKGSVISLRGPLASYRENVVVPAGSAIELSRPVVAL
jgi:hypothetical protein